MLPNDASNPIILCGRTWEVDIDYLLIIKLGIKGTMSGALKPTPIGGRT